MILEKHIANIANAESFNDALNYFQKAIIGFGFQHYFFSNLSTHGAPATFKVNYFKSSYPQEWLDLYIQNKYVFCDPIATTMLANKSPFYWSRLIKDFDKPLSNASQIMMQHAEEYGLKDGLGMSYLHNQGKLHTLSISTPHNIDKYDDTLLAQIYLLGVRLVDAFEKFHNKNNFQVKLSKQEKRIITYGAIGKTDNEIAQLSGISINTVRYHWKNIFNKLESYSRVFAVIQAMNLGLIDSNVLEITTESGSSETYQRRI